MAAPIGSGDAYVEGDWQSDNFHKGWDSYQYVDDALGRRVSEMTSHLDSTQAFTIRQTTDL